ncbi:MAG: YdeI/OmpD-associated family protein [Gammaproteobacteria bacterium]|nr:YdeI/OmpD-associated family protein [Gammaproteobacteria bacterium]
MDTRVDHYLDQGCGRCSLYGTPRCKVKTWHDVLWALRSILLQSELVEDLKWSQPVYTYNGANVVMMSAFKDYAFISFFKGSLLSDPEGILSRAGKNSQAARQLRFTHCEQVESLKPVIMNFLQQAIEIEKTGGKISFKQTSDYEVPEELVKAFEADASFKVAFDALTPGRQRGYLLYFAGARQSSTRHSRIEKSRQRIFNGKGYNER